MKSREKLKIGASFSYRFLGHLNIDPLEAIKKFDQLGLKWIRLGCYWDEIEQKPGEYNFKAIKPLVEFCQKQRISVVLTVGAKSFRWPEFYLPSWLLAKTTPRRLSTIGVENKEIVNPLFAYLRASLKEFGDYSCVKVWQVENEPSIYYGERYWRLSFPLLKKEVDLVKEKAKGLKVMCTFDAFSFLLPGFKKKIFGIGADIIGVDVYFKSVLPGLRNFKRHLFYVKNFTESRLRNLVLETKKQGKKVWISELQAEPWESGELATKKKNPPSFLPLDLEKNFQKANDWAPGGIFFVGI